MAVFARRLIGRCLVLLLLCGGSLPVIAQGEAPTIDRIEVEGTQRIEPATVISYLPVAPGDAASDARLDESLKALYATGLFADVSLAVENGVLKVKVAENPIVNRIAYEGNKQLKEEEIEKEVQLKPRFVYTRSRVQADVDRISELYRRKGRFSARIEPKIVELDQNRVDVVFEIDEGPQSKIRRINFVGNEAFSDDDLRDAVRSKQARWYRFLTSDDTYDPDRTAYDRELLRKFYLTNGYADFQVLSATAELTPDRKDFFLTFTVEEGARYRFGKVEVATELPDLDTKALEALLTTRGGDWYNAEKVEKSIDILTEAVADRQYAFVDVRPQLQRNAEGLTIDVRFQVSEGPRTFIERIDIAGNVRTIDAVIRREMLIAEGDAYNASRIERSEQRIKDLGYFEEVAVETQPGSEADQAVLLVTVKEQSTGELSIGAGFSSTEGALADLRVRERNLLGQGKDLSVSATLSQRTTELDLSYTEPYFLERDLSAGFDLFHITRDYQSESSFDQTQSGFGLRVGYPLGEKLRQRLIYRFERNDINNVSPFASRFIRDQQGTRTTSLIGQELSYDERDSRLNPRQGYRVTLSSQVAGVGGDAKYIRNVLTATVYFPVFDDWTLSLGDEIGNIFGLGQDVRINDRFFLGGDTLRGFAVGGAGPRDLTTDDALGGNTYSRLFAELTAPIGPLEQYGIRGHLFSDAGTLYGIDNTGPGVADTGKLRASVGVGVSWRSPLGPLRVDIARAIVKEDFDETEAFRFSFGTRF